MQGINQDDSIGRPNRRIEKPIISGSVMDSIKQGKIEELKAAFFDDKRISHVEEHLISVREAIK